MPLPLSAWEVLSLNVQRSQWDLDVWQWAEARAKDCQLSLRKACCKKSLTALSMRALRDRLVAGPASAVFPEAIEFEGMLAAVFPQATPTALAPETSLTNVHAWMACALGVGSPEATAQATSQQAPMCAAKAECWPGYSPGLACMESADCLLSHLLSVGAGYRWVWTSQPTNVRTSERCSGDWPMTSGSVQMLPSSKCSEFSLPSTSERS